MTVLSGGLAQITVSHDGEDYVLSRPDLGVFVAVPEPGAVFVTTMQDGGSVAAATAAATAVAGEPVDGEDFLAGLGDAGLLDPPVSARTQLRGVSPRVAARLFGPVAWACYVAFGAAAVAILIVQPDLRPRWQHAFFLDSPLHSIVAFLPVMILLGAGHEAAHWLAARAVGVPATFRVSYRGLYVVFETDLSQVVTLPRRRRYSAFLAGMAFDATVLACALVVRLATDGWLDRILAAVVLNLCFALVWQWSALALRSDGYAVIANALRCHNLYRATWLTLKRLVARLSPAEQREIDAIGAHDRAVARWFVGPYAIGLGIMIWLFATLFLPATLRLLSYVWHNVAGLTVTSVQFWESLVLGSYLVARLVAPALLALRERRLRRAGRLL